MAFVRITHLNPERKNALPEILARFTTMPVRAATEYTEIAFDTVLVIPADAVLSLNDDLLRVIKPSKLQHERKPIDVFRGSLANAKHKYAASVVLSGDDGEATAAIDEELRETRDRLQPIIEEYETALEEIRSSNEEIEASKEELQSLNEELHGETVFPVADILAERGIPFVFATGQDRESIPERHRVATRLSKPLIIENLLAHLATLSRR